MYSNNENDLDIFITELKKQIIRERETKQSDQGFELSRAKQSKIASRMSMNSLRQAQEQREIQEVKRGGQIPSKNLGSDI